MGDLQSQLIITPLKPSLVPYITLMEIPSASLGYLMVTVSPSDVALNVRATTQALTLLFSLIFDLNYSTSTMQTSTNQNELLTNSISELHVHRTSTSKPLSDIMIGSLPR